MEKYASGEIERRWPFSIRLKESEGHVDIRIVPEKLSKELATGISPFIARSRTAWCWFAGSNAPDSFPSGLIEGTFHPGVSNW